VGRSIKEASLVAGAMILLSGCQNVGPLAIDAGRDRYSSAIQSTTKAQTLANIVRVYKHDSTSFVDVTEIDATTTLTGTAGGTVSGIGSKPGTYGILGAATSGVTYTETPLIRYVPLVGQGLVSQMVKPLDVDAVESLIISGWGPLAVLDLVALTLTPDQTSSFAALNIISHLSNHYDVILVAEKSESTGTQPSQQRRGPGGQDNSSGNRPPANDTLTIFYRPSKVPAVPGLSPERAARLWQVLSSFYGGTQKNSPNSIELRTAPVAPARLKDPIKNGAPLLKTYSGIGILKSITEKPASKIRFVSRDEFEEIRHHDRNKNATDLGFYLLSPEEDRDDNPQYKEFQKINKDVEDWISTPSDDPIGRLTLYEKTGLSYADFIQGNRRLGMLRRYILIIKDDVAPENAYVAYQYKGSWYYIDADDQISQKNFHLISLLLTVMAVPPTASPITTSIPVGGGATP
jgi:hypothetical protein